MNEKAKHQVSADTEFNWLTSQIAAHREMPMPAFGLFIQTYSAIVGGSIWLSYEKGLAAAARGRFIVLTDVAVIILAATISVLVWESWRGWKSYRTTHSEILGIAPPKAFLAGRIWFAMIIAMVMAAAVFCLYNPFLT